MLTRTHVVVSLFFGLLAFNYLESLIFIIGLLFGTIILDLDVRGSFVGRFFIFRPVQWIFGHRKLFHSLFFVFIFTGVLALVDLNLATGFIFGAFLHLILDSFTKRGTKVFYPFSRFRFRGFLRTGGLIEEIIFVCFLLLDVLLVILWIFFYFSI
jgi:membrane-bound metal-dependent hydrolase YbcI (DUF457 family)